MQLSFPSISPRGTLLVDLQFKQLVIFSLVDLPSRVSTTMEYYHFDVRFKVNLNVKVNVGQNQNILPPFQEVALPFLVYITEVIHTITLASN